MNHRKIATFFMAFFLASSVVFTAYPEQTRVEAQSTYVNLENSINKEMADSRMKNANSSVTVRRASTGEIIYQSNADKAITPASSLKLLTSASALETLGEDYRFKTEVLADGEISKNKVLNGNLYLKGMGDPTLLKKDFDIMANQLIKLGVKEVTGDLIGDDTFFDKIRLSPSIMKNDEAYSFAAQVSALSSSPNEDYDAGSIIVEAKPTKRGRAANVMLTPATDFVRVINKSTTVAKGNKNTLRITRQYGTNNILITGSAPLGTGGKKEFIAVSNPTRYALTVFKQSLVAKGIKFKPGSQIIQRETSGTAHVLLTNQSMYLKDIMKPFMKLSNNTHAEVLAKTMGKEVSGDGSWNAGLKVMNNYLTSVGLNTDMWKFEDASGMSKMNKVTSNQLTELLYVARSAPWYTSFLQGLPIAGGNDRFNGGTLRNRLKLAPAKGNIYAKTGSLNNTSALAGYAVTRDGETLIFSVLTDNAKSSTLPSIDRIATAIANSKK